MLAEPAKPCQCWDFCASERVVPPARVVFDVDQQRRLFQVAERACQIVLDVLQLVAVPRRSIQLFVVRIGRRARAECFDRVSPRDDLPRVVVDGLDRRLERRGPSAAGWVCHEHDARRWIEHVGGSGGCLWRPGCSSVMSPSPTRMRPMRFRSARDSATAIGRGPAEYVSVRSEQGIAKGVPLLARDRGQPQSQPDNFPRNSSISAYFMVFERPLALCYSRRPAPEGGPRGGTFPQLWKKLWKSGQFSPIGSRRPRNFGLWGTAKPRSARKTGLSLGYDLPRFRPISERLGRKSTGRTFFGHL